MDTNALFKLTYGLYVIGVKNGDGFGGCIVDAVMQATVTPPTLVLSCNKGNRTRDCLLAQKEFTLSVLPETVDAFIIGNFGFQSCRVADKWKKVPHHLMNGLPVLNDAAAWLRCKVIKTEELSTHTLFLCEVVEAVDGVGRPLCYTTYREEMKTRVMEAFKTGTCHPEKENGKMTKWICKVCGYVYEGDELPADYTCPVCGVGAEEFEKVEEETPSVKPETTPAKK